MQKPVMVTVKQVSHFHYSKLIFVIDQKAGKSTNNSKLPDSQKVMIKGLKEAYDKYDRGIYNQDKFKHALKSVSTQYFLSNLIVLSSLQEIGIPPTQEFLQVLRKNPTGLKYRDVETVSPIANN